MCDSWLATSRPRWQTSSSRSMSGSIAHTSSRCVVSPSATPRCCVKRFPSRRRPDSTTFGVVLWSVSRRASKVAVLGSPRGSIGEVEVDHLLLDQYREVALSRWAAHPETFGNIGGSQRSRRGPHDVEHARHRGRQVATRGGGSRRGAQQAVQRVHRALIRLL